MITITLSRPIELDGRTVTAVTVRPLTGRDMVKLDKHFAVLVKLGEAGVPDSSAFAAMIAVAGAVTGLGDAAGDLGLRELTEIMQAVAADDAFTGRAGCAKSPGCGVHLAS